MYCHVNKENKRSFTSLPQFCIELKQKNTKTQLTVILSPWMSSCRSRKSTPMVASTLQGKSPAQRRCVRHVFPTAESPITSTLKVRQRLHSEEDPLPSEPENSREDSMCARSAEPTSARAQRGLQERCRCVDRVC